MPPATANPSGLGGLNLAALASQAHGETKTRVNSGLAQQRAGLTTMFNENQGGRASAADSQSRAQQFARAQALADEMLARRQQAAREAAAAATRRKEILEKRDLDRASELREQRETADWFEQQEFATDQEIRQQVTVAKALASLEGEEADATGPDLPYAREFGGRVISPLRGAALQSEQPGRFDVTPSEVAKVREVYETPGLLPEQRDAMIRDLFGNRSRTASLALYQLYGPDGPEGPL